MNNRRLLSLYVLYMVYHKVADHHTDS